MANTRELKHRQSKEKNAHKQNRFKQRISDKLKLKSDIYLADIHPKSI